MKPANRLPDEAMAASAPRLFFPGHQRLTDIDSRLSLAPEGQLQLAGPAHKLDAAHWPVRRDLAHIALAGCCFVPHYAVPMPRVVGDAETPLALSPKPGADTVGTLPAGSVFDVLDVAGGWAWGITACPEGASTCGISGLGGLVGYVPVSALVQG